jgi:hypothetical protein
MISPDSIAKPSPYIPVINLQCISGTDPLCALWAYLLGFVNRMAKIVPLVNRMARIVSPMNRMARIVLPCEENG